MRYTLLAVALTLFLPCVSARADDDDSNNDEVAKNSVVEKWDRLHMAGARVGFVHTTTQVLGNGDIQTTSETELKMKRMGQTTEIQSNSVTSETAAGTLLRIDSRSKMSANESRTIYTFADGTLTSESIVLGTTRKTERAVPKGLIGPACAERRMRALAGTSDKQIEIVSFIPDFQQVVTTTMASKGQEKVKLHDGSEIELTRVETSLVGETGAPIPMSPVMWIDDQGLPAKTAVHAAGLLIETFRVAREAEAKGEGESSAGPDPDMFNATLLQEDDPIPVPRHLDEAVIIVKKRTSDVRLPDMSDAGHTVTVQSDGSLRIHAVRIVPPKDRAVPPAGDPAVEVGEALEASSMIQSDAPEIMKIAAEVVGDETDPWKAAQMLERWVYENMTQKNMNVAFASALEACRTREGDCTEHAVLLAALCRAAGIPARVVMGLEYLFGVWGGHAWNEVYVAGTWYPLDATNGYGYVDPLHIPMAHMTMKEGGASEFVQIIAGLGNIDVDITDVVRDGRAIPVHQSESLVTQTDGVYQNRIWGISFRTPAGFVFDAPRRRKTMQAKLMELDGKTADGDKVEIEIVVMDQPAGGDWKTILKQFRVDPSDAVERTVDDRVAHVMTETRNGRSQTRVAVMADGALYIFTLDRASAEAERKAFDTFLESVDFDVK